MEGKKMKTTIKKMIEEDKKYGNGKGKEIGKCIA